MPLPRVRLVVLNHNGGALVERCVDHLERLDWPADRLEIVVIDNASTDGSDQRLERRDRVRLIRSGANLGFPANNLGLRDLDGVDYVGLINNDAFAEPGYLTPLVEVLQEHPRVGAACPKILLAPTFLDLVIEAPTFAAPGDGRELSVQVEAIEVEGADVWGQAVFGDGCHGEERRGPDGPSFRWLAGRAEVAVPVDLPSTSVTARVRLRAPEPVSVHVHGGAEEREAKVDSEGQWVEVRLAGQPYDVINNVGSILVEGGWGADRGFLERDAGQYDEAQDVFAWCGAGVLFPVAYLQDVGLFDERFFMYYEDFDLSWRGQSRGWRYRYTPDARLRHVHAATSVEGSRMFQHHVERNRLVMLVKNAPASWALRAVWGFLLATASYGRRDVLAPLGRGQRPRPGIVVARIRSFADFVRLLPHAWQERRANRARRRVHDDAVVGWAVRR